MSNFTTTTKTWNHHEIDRSHSSTPPTTTTTTTTTMTQYPGFTAVRYDGNYSGDDVATATAVAATTAALKKKTNQDDDDRRSTSLSFSSKDQVPIFNGTHMTLPIDDTKNVDDSLLSYPWCLRLAMVGVCLLAIIGASAIVVVVRNNSNNSSSDTTTSGSTTTTTGGGPHPDQISPAEQDTYFDMIQHFLIGPQQSALLLSGGIDGTSPAIQAMEWLAYEDTLYLSPQENEEEEDRLLQRYALTVLYFAHNGPSWSPLRTTTATTTDNNNDYDESSSSVGWIVHGIGVSECQWKFVDCNESNQVIGLHLSGGGITLTGALATEIGLLRHLNHLNLSSNRLEGTIPSDLYRGVTNLVTLDLSRNHFQGGLSAQIRYMSNLEALILSNNRLSGVIPSTAMAQLSNIEILALDGNFDLEGRFDDDLLQVHTKLQSLDISLTKLQGSIPSILPSCDTLEELRLWDADVTGSIPTTLGLCTNLKVLVVGESGDVMGTIPTELGLCTNLVQLQMNYLPGLRGSTLPTELASLSQLKDLDFRWTGLEGTLPTHYGNGMPSLIHFDVSHNADISGTVPTEYGLLTNLKTLLLQETDLTGVVGDEVCAVAFTEFNMDCKYDEGLVCDCCTECSHGDAGNSSKGGTPTTTTAGWPFN